MGIVKKIIDKEYLFNYSIINNNSLKKLFNSDCLIFIQIAIIDLINILMELK